MTDAPTPVLDFRDVSVRFGDATALHDVSFTVGAKPGHGEFIALVGPSGCGKSTILNIVAGFLTPTSGVALMRGAPIGPPDSDRGMIFQQYSSFPHLTVRDNIAFGLRLNRRRLGVSANDIRDKVDALIEHVGLAPHAAKFPHQLSGGQQQRVAIARSFALEPSVLLMDEPFSALDEPTRLDMQQLVVDLWYRRKPTILCVTHSITEAVYLSERVWILTRGPGQIAFDIHDAIPPTQGVPPLDAQEMPEFKTGVRAVTEAFRRACEMRAKA